MYMLIILNVKRMLVYAYNMSGLCLRYFKDTVKIKGSYELILYIKRK
jgi:hypothetical protein